MEYFMKNRSIAIYFFSSLLLLTGVPGCACAAETTPFLPRDIVGETEAGLIYFKPVQILPGLLQDVAEVDLEAKVFTLANGSKWAAPNIDMINGWTKDDQLVVSQNQTLFSTHRYALLNLRLAKATPIDLVRESRPTTEDAYYISKIDYANDLVTLNVEGQQWVVYASDHGTLRKFSEHDRVIIGMNTSEHCDQEKVMRYILIDTATHQYVRATPLNR
jgi:hypothetical protein